MTDLLVALKKLAFIFDIKISQNNINFKIILKNTQVAHNKKIQQTFYNAKIEEDNKIILTDENQKEVFTGKVTNDFLSLKGIDSREEYNFYIFDNEKSIEDNEKDIISMVGNSALVRKKFLNNKPVYEEYFGKINSDKSQNTVYKYYKDGYLEKRQDNYFFPDRKYQRNFIGYFTNGSTSYNHEVKFDKNDNIYQEVYNNFDYAGKLIFSYSKNEIIYYDPYDSKNIFSIIIDKTDSHGARLKDNTPQYKENAKQILNRIFEKRMNNFSGYNSLNDWLGDAYLLLNAQNPDKIFTMFYEYNNSLDSYEDLRKTCFPEGIEKAPEFKVVRLTNQSRQHSILCLLPKDIKKQALVFNFGNIVGEYRNTATVEKLGN